MPRSVLASLRDIVDACASVVVTLSGLDAASYLANCAIRSSVEREFTIIGEAVNTNPRQASELAERISHARKIVGFRNQLVHDDVAVKDEVVWAIVQHDAPVLREECLALIDGVDRAD